MAKYTLSKYDAFKLKYYPVIIPVVTILSLALIFGYCIVNGGDKPPATCEQVTEKLIELGYEPVDATYNYEENISSLEKCIYAQKEDVIIIFFQLDDEASAFSLYSSNNSKISMIARYQEQKEFHDNYSRYSAVSGENTYYDSVYVGNTVVYAQCSYENKEEIYKFITAIKYNASTRENRED